MIETLFYRNPRLTLLALGLILVAGLAALNTLPRQEDPALTERFGSVLVYLPGGSAERVEALITEKIENKLQEIGEVKHLNSRSQTGLSSVRIQLEDTVTEVDGVWSRIRDKVAEVEPHLPPSASTPEVIRNTTAAFTMLFSFTWSLDDQIQLDILHRLAKDLKQKIVLLPGTKETELYGEPQEEILVTLKSDVMASLNFTAEEISAVIRQADAKVSAGRLQGQHTDLIIEVAAQLDSLNRIRNIPLRRGPDGNILRVGDIADVEKKARDPASAMTIIHGKQGIILAAKMESSRRVDRWAAEARVVFDGFHDTLPKGVEAKILFDQSVHTEERLGSLTENLVFGAGLVVVVLFFMMGWRSALLVASALPLTLLMVLPALKVLGVPLHQISLTGLIIALGLLIDNAIVAVDEYTQERLKGHSRTESITIIVRHLFVPLLASTATTILTFLPLVIMPGNAGEFVSTLGVSVILAIIFSLMLSMTIIPALTAYFDRSDNILPKRSLLRSGFSHDGLTDGYRRFMTWVIGHPWRGIAIALVLPVLGFGVAGQLVQQFFPPVDRNQFQIQLKLPAQASLFETADRVQRARDILLSQPEIKNSVWFLGERPPRVYYNVTILDDGSPSFASGFVNTRSAEETHELLPHLQKAFMEAFPDAVLLSLPYEQGPPVEAPIAVRLYGNDIATLQRLGEELRLILSQTKQITYSRATISGGRPKLELRPNETETRLAGFSLVGLARQLSASLDGITGGVILEGSEELPVRVRVSQAERRDLSRIMTNRMTAAGGVGGGVGQSSDAGLPGVPLNVLTDAKLVSQINLITRRDGVRVNTIQAFIEPFVLPGKVLKEFKDRLAASDFQMPPGYRFQYGGESEGSSEARASLIGVFGPLLILMIATVVLAFNSFRYAAVIGLVAIFSIGSALLTLWLFNFPMGFMAVIGTMGLIGLAINDSIVVLSALKADKRASAADAQAIREIVIAASRHIISTTLTTIGGFMPLILWGGTFWPPLAIAISGGMVGATLLALIFVPSAFTIIVRRAVRRAEIRRMNAIARGKLTTEPITEAS